MPSKYSNKTIGKTSPKPLNQARTNWRYHGNTETCFFKIEERTIPPQPRKTRPAIEPVLILTSDGAEAY